MEDIKTNKPIVEGIIAVANHKLRVEGIESYKEYLAQPYYFEKEFEEFKDKFKKKLKEELEEGFKKIVEGILPLGCIRKEKDPDNCSCIGCVRQTMRNEVTKELKRGIDDILVSSNQEFELGLCEKCNQMTNHYKDGSCAKCKVRGNKIKAL